MNKRILFVGIISALSLSACSKQDLNEPHELASIAALKSQNEQGAIGDIRFIGLRDTAIAVGAQGGLAWRAEQINCMLKKQAPHLDKIYNFRQLMLKDNISPPVLAEGRDELHVDDCETVRTADTVYRIIKPPCFASTTPDWREYIWLNFEQPEEPNATLLPKTAEEAGVWNCYVRQGWNQGMAQADQIFIADLARLNRDYQGMVLYHKLYAQHMVTAPFVSKTDLGVTGDAHEMRVNDRVLRIAASAELNTRHEEWQTAVWSERQSPRQPEVIAHAELPKPDKLLKSINTVPQEMGDKEEQYLFKPSRHGWK